MKYLRLNKKYFLGLHAILILYSIGGICSKKAATETFFNANFFFYYILLLLILAVYAFAWQQIIKVLPLSMAFANKSITVIWSLITRHLLLDFEGQPRKRLENSGNPFITKDSGVFLFPFSRKVSDI